MDDLATFVQRATRDSKFNFDSVAEALNTAVTAKEVDGGGCTTYTSQQCRQIFASGYFNDDNTEHVPVPVPEPALEENDTLVVMPPQPPAATGLVATMEPPTTFAGALQFQKSLEEETARRSEAVFSRVLTSLGGKVSERDAAMSDAFELSKEITDILEARKVQKELKLEQERDEKIRKEEETYLRAQKERLRNRFASDSEDNQGENPLADGDMFRAQGMHDEDSSPNGPDLGIPTVEGQFSFDDILSNPNFDRLLDDLEADLNASAADKTEDEGPSELSEVLSFLSVAATVQGARKMETSEDEPFTASVKDLLTPESAEDVARAGEAKKAASLAYKRAAEERVAKAAHAKKVDEALTRAMGVYKPGKDVIPVDGTTVVSASATAAADPDAKDEDDDDDDSEEDDDSWRRQRHARKSESLNAPATQDAKKTIGGSWGAYGASIADTAAGRLAKKEKERANPFFQASSPMNPDTNSEEEESEEENVGEESDGDTKETKVVIREPDVVEEDSDDSGDSGRHNYSDGPDPDSLFEDAQESTGTSIVIQEVQKKEKPAAVATTTTSMEVDESVARLEKELEAASAASSTLSGSMGGSMGSRQRGNKKKDRMKASMMAAKGKKVDIAKSDGSGELATSSTEEVEVAVSLRSGEVTCDAADVESDNPAAGVEEAAIEEEVEPISKFVLESPLPATYPVSVDGQVPILLTVPMTAFSAHSSAGLSCIFDILGGIDVISILGLQLKHLSTGEDVFELLLSGAVNFYEIKLEDALESVTVEQACVSGNCNADCFTLPSETRFIDFCTFATAQMSALETSQFCLTESLEAMGTMMASAETKLACCTLKPYVLETPSTLATFLRLCEMNGLSLSTMRSVQLERNVNYGAHLHPDIKAHIAHRSTSACAVAMGFYCADGDTATKLRDVLGPEDPLLAKRTDPKSVRATLGLDRLQNVTYPVSHSTKRVLSDWLFMFGARAHLPFGITGSYLTPKSRSVLVGFMFSYHLAEMEKGMDSICASLSAAQMHCIKGLAPFPIRESHVVSWSEFKCVFPTAGASKHSTDGPSLLMVFHFHSTCGNMWIEKVKDNVAKLCTGRTQPWRVSTFVSCSERIVNAIEDKAGKNVIAITRDADEKKFQTHEDIGLQDTVIIRGDACQVLDLIISIPPTCSTHVVALKGRLGKSMAVLRGTHIYSTIDSSIEMMRSRQEDAEVSAALPHVVKGKKCLNMIMQEFSDDRVFLAVAHREMQAYVPDYAALTVTANDTTATASSRALFLPGAFDTMAVILISWKIIAGKGGHLARILKRLERDEIRLVRTANVVGQKDMLETLNIDYQEEFGHQADLSHLSGTSCLALLVKGNCCIRRLRDILGPLDGDAEENPRMLNAALKTRAVATLSAVSAESIVRSCFKYQPSLWMQAPDLASSSSGEVGVFAEHICDWDKKVTCAFSSCNSGTEISTVADTLGVTSIDVTCIALTAALLSEKPLSLILEQLHREGLSITNIRSLQLSKKGADDMLNLAGQSSLALKCKASMLSPAPVVVLVLEGSPHALMKVKQLAVVNSNNAFSSTKSLVPQYPTSAGQTLLWALSDGDFGVVAPSSAKLAKAMVLSYFGELYGQVNLLRK
jgi:nucleoside diphosphate kinase